MHHQIAFLSDIHGNLTALNAVLADLDRRGIETVYFLGDVLGRGPAVHEVVELVRTRCRAAVYSNWDVGILNHPHDAGFGSPYYIERVTQEDIAWIRSLPERLEFNFCGCSLVAFHGRPSVSFSAAPMFADAQQNMALCMERFGRHDITVMGDAHRAFMLVDKGRWLMNTGAVGTPTDGLPCASYLILKHDHGALSSEHVRVRYDLAQEVSRALRTPGFGHIPDYITEISTGEYTKTY